MHIFYTLITEFQIGSPRLVQQLKIYHIAGAARRLPADYPGNACQRRDGVGQKR